MYAKENYIGKAEPGDSLAQILAHRPTMHNFSVATGLEPVAKKLGAAPKNQLKNWLEGAL